MLSTDLLLFGSDPEYATGYEKDGVVYVEPPAYFRKYLGVDFEPDEKHPVFIRDSEIEIMEDGCAFEYTLPAFANSNDLFSSIQRAHSLLSTWLSNYDYELLTVPTLDYEVLKWVNEDDEFKNCIVFGCDPDKDAIDESYVCQTIDALQHPYRYFGGHLHVGSLDPDVVNFLQDHWKPYIHLLACLVGTTGVAYSPYPDLEVIRGKVYGRPGRYRLPNWGIEYRTLSNAWTTDKTVLEMIIERAKIAFELVQYPEKALSIMEKYLYPTCQAIATCDATLATEILTGIDKEI
jgi:hypothetical protein